MDVERKDRKYQWAIVTNMMDGWKIVTFNVENYKKLMDLLKDRHTQFGLDPILMVLTAGTCAIKAITRTISGEDYWDVDINNFKSVIVDINPSLVWLVYGRGISRTMDKRQYDD